MSSFPISVNIHVIIICPFPPPVISVTPHIEGLLSLVDELNSCNDLYQFAKSVRMQFKDLVKKLPS